LFFPQLAGIVVVLIRVARPLHQLVALLVHQQLALVAFESLPTKAPYSVTAEGAKCSLQHTMGNENKVVEKRQLAGIALSEFDLVRES
jgi:hypothetical protein